jgi:hypothetical protein
MSYDSAVQELIYTIRNGKIEDFKKTLNKTPLASKHLSFNVNEEGNFELATQG